jgi:hypothetical protein
MSQIKSTVLDEFVSFLTSSSRRIVSVGGNPLDIILPERSTITGAAGGQLEATGTLSQANITSMYTAGIELVPAPGAGKTIIVDEIELFHDYATAAYTGGADVVIEYDASTDIFLFDSTLITATSDAKVIVWPTIYHLDSSTGTATGFDILTVANKAIKITNGTQVFAAGNASNIVKYRVRYHIVTLLT